MASKALGLNLVIGGAAICWVGKSWVQGNRGGVGGDNGFGETNQE